MKQGTQLSEALEKERICKKCHTPLVSKPFKWYDWIKKYLRMGHWELYWCPKCTNWCLDWYLKG